jgi:hypothetical protein
MMTTRRFIFELSYSQFPGQNYWTVLVYGVMERENNMVVGRGVLQLTREDDVNGRDSLCKPRFCLVVSPTETRASTGDRPL